MIISNQSIRTMQNYVAWIQAALLFILKLKMFMKTLKVMLKKDLKSTDHLLRERIKK